MFAKTIVLSDAFLDMPLSARCLYFTLGMLADDDGFINSPKSIIRQCGASEDDMKLLILKKFVLPFDTGIIVIKHWRINNYLQKDRYNETKYLDEKKTLEIEPNGAYTRTVYTQVSIGKYSIDKNIYIEPVPLNDGTEYLPTEAEISEYTCLYPSVDIIAEFRKIRAWCISNPAKKKTKTGVKRFINSWLSREQDKPKRRDIMPTYSEADAPQETASAEEIERLLNAR